MPSLSNLKKNLISDTDSFGNAANNNWHYVRLLAALGVIYGHSTLLTPGGTAKDFFSSHVAKNITYSGQIAVIIFFYLSGALVTKSLRNSISPFQFAAKRLARIYPGLVICVALSSLFLPISLGNTFNAQSSIKYFIQNAPAITNEYFIPGLFTSAKNQVVNGSLWTLPNEIRLYFILFTLFCLVPVITKRTFMTFNFILIWLLIFAPQTVPLVGSGNELKGNSLWVINSIFFFIGSNAYLSGFGKLRSWVYLVISFSLYGIWIIRPSHHLIFFLAVICSVTFVSKIQLPHRLTIKADYSYGIYLYGWPSAQIINQIYPWTTSMNGFVLSSILAMFFAIFSWHLIEKPSMKLVRKLAK